MKRLLAGFLLLLILILGWLIWKQSTSELAPNTEKTHAPVTNPPTPSVPANQTAGVTVPPHLLTPEERKKRYESTPMEPRIRAYLEHQAEDPQWDWKRPISFYGKVVDENNRPVAGATARCEWTTVSAVGYGYTAHAEVGSDQEGLFSLSGQHGKNLGVRVEKDGYYTVGGLAAMDFEYAAFFQSDYYEPDPNHPVIFHLKKKGDAEPMVHWQKLVGFSIDGTPSRIYSTGMVVSITRDSTAQTAMGLRFNWNVTLTLPNGGFIESNDEFMFTAPDSGYQPTITIQGKASDVPFHDDVTRQYYISMQNGKAYGRIKLDMYPRYNDDAAIDMEVWVNPSGSRNLEYDPAKQINK